MEFKKELNFDVCVAGGGAGGIAAALQCQREGLSTLLVERSTTLGGLAANGYVPQIAGGVEGICKELVQRLDNLGQIKRVKGSGDVYVLPVFEPEYFKLVSEQMLVEEGVSILYNTMLVSCECKDRTVSHAVLCSQGMYYKVDAKYFIDATGTGDLLYAAGTGYDFGSEEYGGYNMSTSQGIRFAGANLKEYFAACEEWKKNHENPMVYDMEEELLKKGAIGRHVFNKGNGFNIIQLPNTDPENAEFCTFSFHSYCCKNDDAEDVSAQIIQQHQDMVYVHQFLKDRVPGFKNLRITGLGSMPGFREGRRFNCLYRLTDKDFMTSRKFEDGISRYPEALATHHPTSHDEFFIRKISIDGVLTEKNTHDWVEIPYRCMVPENLDNALGVGRCLSGEFHASCAFRIIGPSMDTGLAAGIACGLAEESGRKLSELDGELIREKEKLLGLDLDNFAPGYN